MKKLLRISLSVLLVILIAAASAICAGAATSVKVNFVSDGRIFKTVTTEANGMVAGFYDLPCHRNKAFAGWYYENGSPLSFDADIITADTDVYARWIDVESVAPEAADEGLGDSLGGFELLGIQLRGADGGLRFITSLSEKLLTQLDALSIQKVDGENVEYGFAATKKSNIDNWLSYAGGKVDGDLYAVGYNGANVNGVDTTVAGKDFQGFVKNIKCNTESDFRNTDNYRIYSLAVTYEGESAAMTGSDITARAYLRYYDANEMLRTFYGNYGGCDAQGGCSASLDGVEAASEGTRYYSTVAEMVTDANNLTTDNGSSNPQNAEGSLYIRDNKAYMKLLKDSSWTGGTISANAELNLCGNRLSVGSSRIRNQSQLTLTNGEYSSDSTGFFINNGKVKVRDVDFISAPSSNFVGFISSSGENAVLSDCSFDINYTGKSGFVYVTYLHSGDLKLDGCSYSIKSVGETSFGVRADSGNLSVNNCDFAMDIQTSGGSACRAIAPFDVCESATVRNTSVTYTGTPDFAEGIGVMKTKSESSPTAAESCVLNYEKCRVNFDVSSVNSGESCLIGYDVRSDAKATIKDCDARMKVTKSGNASIYGAYTDNTAEVSILGGEYTSEASLGSSYYMYNIIALGDSKLRCSGITSTAPAFDDPSDNTTCNAGIYTGGNSEVTVDEEYGSVFVKGGNAGICCLENSQLFIKGGNFCSPTHGGAYISGKGAEITGGSFYTVFQSGFTQYGGMYVIKNAVVNAENASFIGGAYGIRTKDGNPVVNVKNCYIEAGSTIFSVSAGAINDLGGNTTHIH